MMAITARDEIVAPVIMSISLAAPEPEPGFTPASGAVAPTNSATKDESLTILSPRPGVSLLSSTFMPSTREPA